MKIICPSSFITLFVFISVVTISSCEITDGTTIIDEHHSPYYLKLNQEGKLLDVCHGINNQAASNITIQNPCEWLFNDCNKDNDVDTLYFASSFGSEELGDFNFIITNFPYSEDVDLNDRIEIQDLLKELPLSDGFAEFATGSLTQGVQEGNIFIGKSNFKHGYAFPQWPWANFKILEIKQDDLFGEKVVGIKFTFNYTIFNDMGGSVALMNGEGCLPFGLHGQK